jgi:hypothetical protein
MSKKRKSLKDGLKKTTEENIKNKDSSGNFGKRAIDSDKLPEGIKFFKPAEGKNLIDIIPYFVETDNHPHREKGEPSYVLDYWIHKNVGPGEDDFLCLKNNFGQSCPICEHEKELRKEGVDKEERESLWPKRRVLYNVIDLNDEDEGVQLYDVSYHWFEKELRKEAEEAEDNTVIFADLEDGRSIKFRGSQEKFNGREFIKPEKILFQERDEEYDEDILDDSIALDTLLYIPTYEEVQDAFYGRNNDEPVVEDEEDIVEEKETKRKKKHRKKEVDEEEECPVEEKSSKKKSKKSKDKCPHEHKFGKDCDDYDECSDCEIWEDCDDASV